MFQRLFLGLLLGLVGINQAQADLVLTLDTDAKTFWFEGSEDVEFEANPFNAQLNWRSGGGTTTESVLVFTGTMWTVTNGTPFGPFGSYTTGIFLDDGLDSIVVALSNSAGGSNTITGTGMASQESYSGLSTAGQTFLESLIGQEISVNLGTASSLSIASSFTAVPEPSSLATFGLIGAFVCFRRQRKQGPSSFDNKGDL
jgi:hypothetical protein